MDDDLKYIDLFDKYIGDNLPEEEKVQFEKRLKEDSGFSKEFHDYQEIIAVAKSIEQAELKETIRKTSQKLEAEGLFLDENDIDDFLSGTANKETDALIKSKITTDQNFADKVIFEKNILEGLKEREKESLMKTLAATEKKMAGEGFFQESKIERNNQDPQTAKKAKVIPFWKKYQAIAAVLLIATLGLVWLIKNSQIDTEQIFNDNYSKEIAKAVPLLKELGNVGAVGDDAVKIRKNRLYRPLKLYYDGNIKKAITELNKHLEIYSNDESAQFYLGLSYLEDQNYITATKLLLPLVNKENSNWKNEAAWYLSLAYLKIPDKINESKNLLNKISENGNSPYKEKAKDILSRL